ncbi:excalibur calcium-binding domain-containing protein [Nocardia mangyaensis]|uniref:excalibur calcium-binding domain-containing protein n=1 Tax=Nocardia mangyaensis TaxID=2213200 RepID=UPI002676103C|nr:excalibur calcium-binding domain-containing protein [Nocardia mangyaensis]MDO3650970.1 excalibur calcium-binding domain-containing protein [Nocardia mangyaensis]
MNRPQQPPDQWARPQRTPNKKRRWPVVAGIGAAGAVGLLVGVGVGDEPSSVAHTTTIRVVETVTVTPAPTTVETGAVETTAEEVPVAPIAPAPSTTIEVPPPPVVPRPPPTTVEASAPRVATVPTAEPPPASTAYYQNCAEARAAGAAPMYVGDPGYRSGLDRDNDGIACE